MRESLAAGGGVHARERTGSLTAGSHRRRYGHGNEARGSPSYSPCSPRSRSSAPSSTAPAPGAPPRHATTTTKPKPDPNRVVTPTGRSRGAADRRSRQRPDPARRPAPPHALALPDRRRPGDCGRQLVFDDDTFVEPGGKAMVTNEEDHRDILSIDIATHARHAPLRAGRACRARRPGLAELARRRLRPARRDDDRGRRLQLPHPLHPERTGSCGRSAAPASVSTTRRARSAPSTATRRSRTAACSSRRSTAPGSTTSAAPAACAGRSRRPSRTRRIRSRCRAAGSSSPTTRPRRRVIIDRHGRCSGATARRRAGAR